MSRLYIMLFALALIDSGCVTRVQYVVLRDIPLEPTFTVIPPNRSLDEVAFANAVEIAVVGAGARVISPPSTAFVVEERKLKKGDLSAHDLGASGATGEATTTLSYWVYDNLSATYVVSTIKWGNFEGQIKIEDRATREVLTVFVVNGSSSFDRDIADAVKSVLGRSTGRSASM